MLYLVPMYMSWSPPYISTKICTNSFHVTSLLRHIRQNVKNGKKVLFLTITILGTSDFCQVCGKGFLEWKVKHKTKVWDRNKETNKNFKKRRKQKTKTKQKTKNKTKKTKKTKKPPSKMYKKHSFANENFIFWPWALLYSALQCPRTSGLCSQKTFSNAGMELHNIIPIAEFTISSVW